MIVIFLIYFHYLYTIKKTKLLLDICFNPYWALPKFFLFGLQFFQPHHPCSSQGDKKLQPGTEAKQRSYTATGPLGAISTSREENQSRVARDWEEGEGLRVYAASVATLLWLKALEGLTSHLESFIQLCIPEYDRVCGWGLGVICATALVVFQCLITVCGYDQRYARGYACGQFFHSKPWTFLHHCVYLWLWAWGVYRYALCAFSLVMTKGCCARESWRPHSTFSCCSRKTGKPYEDYLIFCHYTSAVWVTNWKLSCRSDLLWRVVVTYKASKFRPFLTAMIQYVCSYFHLEVPKWHSSFI